MQTIVNAFAPCLSALCLTFGFCQLVGTTSIESSSYFPAAVTLLFSGPKCAPIAVGFHANALPMQFDMLFFEGLL